jgi:hypothetical protein
VLEEAAALGIDLQTSEGARRVFMKAVDEGDGDRDMSAVIAQYRRSPHPAPGT